MKLLKLMLVVAAAALVLGVPAKSKAQDSGTFTMASNNVPVNFTNTAPSTTVITVPSICSCVYLWHKANSGSTTNVAGDTCTFWYGLSQDGTNYLPAGTTLQSRVNPQITNATSQALAPNGVSTVTGRLAIDTRGAKYVKLMQMANAAGASANATNYWTNIVIDWCAAP